MFDSRWVAGIGPTGWTLEGRWWNGAYGRIARRDMWLYTNGYVWRVEARQGDGDAAVWSKQFTSEQLARELAAQMMARSGDQWRDLTSLVQSPPTAGR
ncbi:hypothetical protein [Rhizocola hellebori]|uniref:hypothetical protein n=1 Tax=Rhizocola hellebori TaxID=1392758 RepID=UPI00194550A9|nr:hypothetical protein [Rhizocola hellebori]